MLSCVKVNKPVIFAGKNFALNYSSSLISLTNQKINAKCYRFWPSQKMLGGGKYVHICNGADGCLIELNITAALHNADLGDKS